MRAGSVNRKITAAAMNTNSIPMIRVQNHSVAENDSGQPCQNGKEATAERKSQRHESKVKNRVLGLFTTSRTVQLPVSKLSGYDSMRPWKYHLAGWFETTISSITVHCLGFPTSLKARSTKWDVQFSIACRTKFFVAQISKSAVSPISNRLGVGYSTPPGWPKVCGLKIRDTAILRYNRRILSCVRQGASLRVRRECPAYGRNRGTASTLHAAGRGLPTLPASLIFLWTKAKASYSVVCVKKISPHFFAGRTGEATLSA
jgi:hypothetical protein